MLKRYLLTAALCTAAACSSSKDSTSPNTTGTGNTATSAQVSGMVTALAGAGAFTLSPTAFSNCTNASCTLSSTTNCPGGGTVSVNGNYSYSQSGTSFSYSGTVTQSYSGCKSAVSGTTYQFDGTGLTMTVNATVAGTAVTYSLHETGNMAWSSGSSSGSCPVDITASLNSGGTYAYTGTYCGISVSP